MDDKTIERFWAKIKKAGPEECWLWLGAKNPKGRGNFGIKYKTWSAPRVMWLLLFGDPCQAHVLHSCDNPQCVNPRHLFLGDQAVNMKDRSAKGRQPHGEKHGLTRLTAKDVSEIRSTPAFYGRGAMLARRYGVSRVAISNIISGHRWIRTAA